MSFKTNKKIRPRPSVPAAKHETSPYLMTIICNFAPSFVFVSFNNDFSTAIEKYNNEWYDACVSWIRMDVGRSGRGLFKALSQHVHLRNRKTSVQPTGHWADIRTPDLPNRLLAYLMTLSQVHRLYNIEWERTLHYGFGKGCGNPQLGLPVFGQRIEALTLSVQKRSGNHSVGNLVFRSKAPLFQPKSQPTYIDGRIHARPHNENHDILYIQAQHSVTAWSKVLRKSTWKIEKEVGGWHQEVSNGDRLWQWKVDGTSSELYPSVPNFGVLLPLSVQ